MHYSIREISSIVELKQIFPTGEADELNFCLFSTSGVHGHYTTIEEIEDSFDLPDGHEDKVDMLTVLVVHPRTVTMKYGNIHPVKEEIEYLKRLRKSSQEAVQKIGVK